jgi:hypothetical protein
MQISFLFSAFYDDDDYDDIPDPNQELATGEPEGEADFKRLFTIRVDTDPCDKVRRLALLNLTTKDGPVVYEEPPPEVLLQLSTPEPTPEYAEVNVEEEMQADAPVEEKEVQEVEHEAGLDGEVKYKTENAEDDDVNVEEEGEGEGEEEEVTEEPTEEPFVFHSR